MPIQSPRFSWMAGVALAAAVGCGGTVKDVDATSAGSGGAGGGGTGGAGGGGAGGGGGGTCDALVPLGEPFVVDWPSNESGLSPKLVRSALDAKTVVLAFMGVPVEGPAGILNEIHVRLLLDPWSTWPPVDGSNAVLADAQGTFAISEGAGIEAAVLRGTSAGPVRYDLMTTMGIGFGGTSLPPDATQAALLRMHPGGHVVGYGRPHTGDTIELLVGLAHDDKPKPTLEGFTPIGCTKTSVLMDAVHTEKGTLVGFASNDDPASAKGCTGSLGAATRGVVARVTDGNPVGTELAATTPDNPAWIMGLAMAGRSDGAWLTVGRSGWIEATATIQAHLLDAAGTSVAAPFTLAGSSDLNPDSVGASSMADDLVAAWSYGALSADRIEVKRVNAAGAVVATAMIEATPGPPQPIAVLGSPTGDAVLLAYSAISPVDQTARIHLQRLGCIPAP
ncbi:hypothetical protein [Polyangium sp. y55x31]|uniref:hypothetical protein n=1 Tax=Polyangium sp. y55x31 TaxID=3042688 RepID=UPI002482BD1D|nr:hypothetical protein [Polyangium sp. y55x31]MDI1480195.1 hypothetical protein [Polyangium sp. y55x31]